MMKRRLLLMLLILFLLCSGRAQAFRLQETGICKNLEDFLLRDMSGEEVALGELIEDAPLLFVFWTSWCPYCRITIRDLISTASQINTSQVALINIGESRRKVEAFLSRFRDNPFRVLLDAQGELASDCRIVGVPTFIIIDKEGEVEFTGHYLPENYAELLNGLR